MHLPAVAAGRRRGVRCRARGAPRARCRRSRAEDEHDAIAGGRYVRSRAAAGRQRPSASRRTRRARAATIASNLDTTIVTGNRELPKVLYIVPWKKADLGDLPAQPFNTLLDEALTPVDRDVFRREVTYYGAVSSGGNASPAARRRRRHQRASSRR